MELNEYINILIKYRKKLDEEIKEAIVEQKRLHDIAVEIAKERWALQEKSDKLIMEGCKKFFNKYPEYKNIFGDHESKSEHLRYVVEKFLEQSPEMQEMSKRRKEIPELRENDKITTKLMDLTYEYFNADINLDVQINKDRKRFFSKEYIDRMDELAKEGVLLYFLETPDLPLLEEGVDSKIIMDMLLFNDCRDIKVLLFSYLTCEYSSDVMKRKQVDLVTTMFLLENKCYRAAARNLFALLDSEHKRAAEAFNGFFEKEEFYRNGGQRAKKIDDLVSKINIDWISMAWEKVNNYFKDITSTNPINGVIHRNSIIHGDYASDYIEPNKYDIVKLILLWLNMQMVSEYMVQTEDLYENILSIAWGLSQDLNEEK